MQKQRKNKYLTDKIARGVLVGGRFYRINYNLEQVPTNFKSILNQFEFLNHFYKILDQS